MCHYTTYVRINFKLLESQRLFRINIIQTSPDINNLNLDHWNLPLWSSHMSQITYRNLQCRGFSCFSCNYKEMWGSVTVCFFLCRNGVWVTHNHHRQEKWIMEAIIIWIKPKIPHFGKEIRSITFCVSVFPPLPASLYALPLPPSPPLFGFSLSCEYNIKSLT